MELDEFYFTVFDNDDNETSHDDNICVCVCACSCFNFITVDSSSTASKNTHNEKLVYIETSYAGERNICSIHVYFKCIHLAMCVQN